MTESQWMVCTDPATMLAYITLDQTSTGWRHLSDRRLRLFACAIERAWWGDGMGKLTGGSIQVAEAWADGLLAADSGEVQRFGRDSGWWMDPNAADAARESLRTHDVRADQISWAALLRDIVGNPYRPVRCRQTLNPLGSDLARWAAVKELPGCDCAWITATVRDLARAAYDERLPDGTLDSVRLAITADALEEAGATDAGLLQHLREKWQPCPDCENESGYRVHCRTCEGSGRAGSLRVRHVRGCWAVDLLTGRE